MNSIQLLLSDLKKIEKKSGLVIVVSACSLAAIHYFSAANNFYRYKSFLQTVGLAKFFKGIYYYLNQETHASLWRLVYWASITIFFYAAVPMLLIKLVFKEQLREYGLKRKNIFESFSVYALLFACVFPVVVAVSFSPQFQSTYPFYTLMNARDIFPYLLIWEFFYVLQFFSLEFFFRGFLVHGLKKQLGIYTVAAMVIPYCMIHFTKPLPECLGSIFAGFILGLLSYRTGSVWLGALIHIAVALSMDILSLWHRGFIF